MTVVGEQSVPKKNDQPKQKDPAREAMDKSVESLKRFYAIIIGLAVTEALRRTFTDHATGTFSTQGLLIPQFISLLITIIPFFHGMNRHLEHYYILDPNEPSDGAMLFDFFSFVLQSCAFFCLATMMGNPVAFAWCLLAIVAADVLWTVITKLIHRSSAAAWAVVNIIYTIALLILILQDLKGLPVIVAVITTLRTAADYRFSWSFYFPMKTKVT